MLALWVIAAVLAVAVGVGMAYDRSGEPKATVMVARQLIPAGSYVKPGAFDFLTVPQDEVEQRTLTDVRYLAYHYVAQPIYPGTRFRTSDFTRRLGLSRRGRVGY